MDPDADAPMGDAAPTSVISIVVATRNAAGTLPGCLEAVLRQDYPAVDLVVVDGASTDGTVSILEAYSGRLGHWMSEPDTGVYSAWNKAIRHIRGEWVCFLGADDRLATPSVLSDMAPRLAQRPARVVYGITHVTAGDGQVLWSMGRPWLQTRADLADHMSLPNPSTFYHRELFRVHGTFDESFQIAGDYEFLLRELVGHPAVFVDTVVVRMGAGGVSQDLRNRARSLREAERARRQNGLTARRFRRTLEILEADLFVTLHRRAGKQRLARNWEAYKATVGRLERWAHASRRRVSRLLARS